MPLKCLYGLFSILCLPPSQQNKTIQLKLLAQVVMKLYMCDVAKVVMKLYMCDVSVYFIVVGEGGYEVCIFQGALQQWFPSCSSRRPYLLILVI